jgi:hypothetical protein
LGGTFFYALASYLLSLIQSVLLVLCFLIATLSLSLAIALALDNVLKLLVELKVPLESIEHGQYGHNFVIVGGFGSPRPLYLEPIVLAHGRGHEGLVGDSGESSVKVVFVLAANILPKVLTGNKVVGL